MSKEVFNSATCGTPETSARKDPDLILVSSPMMLKKFGSTTAKLSDGATVTFTNYFFSTDLCQELLDKDSGAEVVYKGSATIEKVISKTPRPPKI